MPPFEWRRILKVRVGFDLAVPERNGVPTETWAAQDTAGIAQRDVQDNEPVKLLVHGGRPGQGRINKGEEPLDRRPADDASQTRGRKANCEVVQREVLFEAWRNILRFILWLMYHCS